MSDSNDVRLTDVLKAAVQAAAADLHVSLPGRVERFDPTTQLADIAPLLQDSVELEGGELTVVDFPVITNVPVQFLGGGGFRLTFPLAKGDLGMLLFSDRSLDKWLSGDGNKVDPGFLHLHSLADAVFLPGVRAIGKALTGVATDHATLGQDGGLQAHFKATVIEVGEAPTDAAALNSKVVSRLNAIENRLNDLVGVYNGHVHEIILQPIVGVLAPPTAVTGTCSGETGIPVELGDTVGTTTEVASALLKLKT